MTVLLHRRFMSEQARMIHRSTSKISCVCFSANEDKIIIGTEDGEIKCISVAEITEIQSSRQHRKCILQLASGGGLLASIDEEGALKIWKNMECVHAHSLSIKPKTASLSWNSNELLVVGNSLVQVFSEESKWESSFAALQVDGKVLHSTWIQQKYIGIITDRMEMLFWNHERVLYRQEFKSPSSVQTARFSGACLAFIDADGYVNVVSNVSLPDLCDFDKVTSPPVLAAKKSSVIQCGEKPVQARDISLFSSQIATKSEWKHPVLQPGATKSQKGQRLLAWNGLGTIISRRDADPICSIDVEFHDRSKRPVRFEDDSGFCYGAIGSRAVVFCSNFQSAVPNIIHCIPIESWGTRQAWTFVFDGNEEPIAAAVDDGLVWVATSRKWLRSFSINGIQNVVFQLPGELIGLAARGKHMSLFTTSPSGIVHVGLYREGRLVKTSLLGTRDKDSQLTWMGFSECEQMVGCYDRTGCLYVWMHEKMAEWMPAYLHQCQEVLWPVLFTWKDFSAARCKNNSSEPSLAPRPFVGTIAFRIPLVQMNDPVVQMQEEVLKSQTFLPIASDCSERERKKLQTASDKKTLEIIQLSIKSDRLDRVAELCELLFLEKSFDLASQLARHARLVQLGDKIAAIKDRRISSCNPAVSERPKANSFIEQDSVKRVSEQKRAIMAATAEDKAETNLASRRTEETQLMEHDCQKENESEPTKQQQPVRSLMSVLSKLADKKSETESEFKNKKLKPA